MDKPTQFAPPCRQSQRRYLLLNIVLVSVLGGVATVQGFDIREATIEDIRKAFDSNKLTSRSLLEYYLDQIQLLNPVLRAVIEVNPDALQDADKADAERQRQHSSLPLLHGIPVLLKDNIATKGKLNTTAGSFALLGSVSPRDAGVVQRLRAAGAVIMGKASLSEWCNFRSVSAPAGWSPRGGQGKNPYTLSGGGSPCGSSSGSAIAVAANMAAVSLGTEVDGSIICPSSFNSVVGFKPTVGLTSRAGVIPVSPRMDSVGPICRTVADAVAVLDAIVRYDIRDPKATGSAAKFIPEGGYLQFLNPDGLRGKRLGILKSFFAKSGKSSHRAKAYESHFNTLRQRGATVVDNLQIPNISTIMNQAESGERTFMLADFKENLNQYLSELIQSPVRSLEDIINFNNQHREEEKIDEYGQLRFIQAEGTNGFGPAEQAAAAKMSMLCKEGLEKLMAKEKLDAIVTPDARASSVLAIGGYPGVTVPAGYDDGAGGAPFGITFGGLLGSEPKLIEIAYGFEQATKVRKPPPPATVETDGHLCSGALGMGEGVVA